MKRALIVVVIASAGGVGGAIAGCGGKPAAHPAVSEGPRIVTSNVLRRDYAGSEACADCHAEIYKHWAASPMRNMTRDAAHAQIRAPFDGATLRIGDSTATMAMEDGKRIVTVTSPKGSETFHVTKVVGGRYREDFVGKADAPGALEHVLPATYVFATKSWRYKGYSVMVKERPELSVRAVWQHECIACHNTLPLATNLYDDLYGPDLPSYQGKLSDRAVPQSLVWKATTRDGDGLASALREEIVFLGREPQGSSVRALLKDAAAATEEKLDGGKLVELGIGCEACHNGSKAHVADPKVLPTFAASSPLLGLDPPPPQTGTRAQWINHTCAKCHTVLFTRYPYTWEGGTRRKNPGGSTTNSGEGRDFKLGGCSTQMSCATCHDPHAEDPRAKLDELATPAGNVVCAKCHDALVTNVAQHSHHEPGAGQSCIGCHMPKKNMGLDYQLVRYHRIGSPTDAARVTKDRPLECALCHADKSVESLVSTMEQWWKKKYDRDALHKLYGDNLDTNVLRATLFRGKPHEQAAAIGVLGDAKDSKAIPAIATHLAHDYPLVRYYAKRALEKITGSTVDVDVNQPAADALRDAKAWVRALAAQGSHPSTP